MGFFVEINSLLKILKTDNILPDLQVGKTYTLKKDNTRLYMVDVPMVLVDEDWYSYGYAVVKKLSWIGKEVEVSFEVLSLFTPEESKVHTDKLIEALKLSGYFK